MQSSTALPFSANASGLNLTMQQVYSLADEEILAHARRLALQNRWVEAILCTNAVHLRSPALKTATVQLDEIQGQWKMFQSSQSSNPAPPPLPPAAPLPNGPIDFSEIKTAQTCLAAIRGCLNEERWSDILQLQSFGTTNWPDEPGFIYASAQCVRIQGHYSDAIKIYLQYLDRCPGRADAFANIGVCYLQFDEHEKALYYFQQAVDIAPSHAFSWFALGFVGQIFEQYALAESFIWRGLDVDPYKNVGIGWLAAGLCKMREIGPEQKKKIDALCKCWKNYSAGSAEDLANLAVAAWYADLLAQASDFAQRSIALDSGKSNTAHATLMWSAMLQGDLRTGFRELEMLWADRRAEELGLYKPSWRGEPLQGQTLVLYATGGFGDVLQFSRFLPFIQNEKLVLICPAELVQLMKFNFPALRVVTAEEWAKSPSEYAYHLRLMSLPYVLQLDDFSKFPDNRAYMRTHPDDLMQWSDLLGAHSSPRIGVAWRGNPKYSGDATRSMPLRMLEGFPHACEEATWFSLQKGEIANVDIRACEFDSWLLNVDGRLTDFSATAGLIANLDLVITVDTSIAHLAGSLGCKVWLMLPQQRCWRWMVDRSDSPWYANMRLFRQSRPGDWSNVARAICEALGNGEWKN